MAFSNVLGDRVSGVFECVKVRVRVRGRVRARVTH